MLIFHISCVIHNLSLMSSYFKSIFVADNNRKLSKQSIYSTEDADRVNNNEVLFDSTENRSRSKLYTLLAIKILRLNAPEWYWIILGVTASIILGIMESLFPFFIAQIYEVFGNPDISKQKRLTIIYACGIFAIGIMAGLCEFSSSFGFAKSGEALTMRMRHLSFAALLRQEISYFDFETNSVGALVTRLATDASALKVKSYESRRKCEYVMRIY